MGQGPGWGSALGMGSPGAQPLCQGRRWARGCREGRAGSRAGAGGRRNCRAFFASAATGRQGRGASGRTVERRGDAGSAPEGVPAPFLLPPRARRRPRREAEALRRRS